MLEERRGASGIVLGQSVLWIVGGRDGRFSGLSSSEFIQIGRLTILFKFPPNFDTKNSRLFHWSRTTSNQRSGSPFSNQMAFNDTF